MSRLNCWEFKKCGRDPGGNRANELGVCPASTDTILDGINGGVSAGRCCWVIAGTMCNGLVQGSFARKYKDCGICDFYNAVKEEEQESFMMTVDLLKMIDSH